MTLPRRVDANHAEIVAAYRALGVAVLDLHEVGKGCPDLLVAIDGCSDLVEVKTAGGTFTPAEREFIDRWPEAVVVVRSVEDVERHVAEMAAQGRRKEALCSGSLAELAY